MEQDELPPELDENTPVVWPTDPEEETDAGGVTSNDNANEDDSQGTSSSKASTYSYWFGGVMKEKEDEDEESLDEDEKTEEEEDHPQLKRSKKKDEEDDDPDWTEEIDGIVMPKKRVKRKQDISNTKQSSGSIGNAVSSGENKQSSRFRFQWTEDFSWLKYDSQSKEMFCSICQQAGQKGEFATEGSKNFGKTSLYFHNCSAEHKEAELIVKRLSSKESDDSALLAPEPTPDIEDEEDIEPQNTLFSDTALIAALRTAFYAAQNDHDKAPTDVYKSMMALQDACNVPGTKALRLGKHSDKSMVLNTSEENEADYAFGDDESLAEMHDVLARIVQEDLYNKINHCGFISIIIQEYPNADLQPLQMQLVVHARYTHKGQLNVGFLGIVMASEDKPDEAVKEILTVLEECDIMMQKVVAVEIQCPKKNGKLLTSSRIHHWQMAKSFADLDADMIVLVSAQRHLPWHTCISLATQSLEEGKTNKSFM